jgi:hypothetical protein
MKNITAIFDKIEPMMDRKNISGIVAVIDGDDVGTDICGDMDEILVLLPDLMADLISQYGEDAIVSAVRIGKLKSGMRVNAEREN